MLLNEILVRERKARGLSQEELATRIQVSRQAVSKWETGDAMPDLNKLLALADALDISLDVLCGRSDYAVATESDPAPTPGQKRPWLLPLFCGLLVGLLAMVCLWAWQQKNVVPAAEGTVSTPLSQLSEEFTVTGLGFSPQSDDRIAYWFTPSISGEGLTYQITFTDSDSNAYTFDAPYSGGVCSGEATFDFPFSYAVTVSVTDGTFSRNLAVAINLNFSRSGASWNPLVD